MEFEGIYKGVFEMPQTANERHVLSLQQFMQFQTLWKKSLRKSMLKEISGPEDKENCARFIGGG